MISNDVELRGAKKKPRCGFTLVELLVVIAIIGILYRFAPSRRSSGA